jgi:predicted peptidase
MPLKYFIPLLFLVFIHESMQAQPDTLFQKHSLVEGEDTLPYRLAVPQKIEKEKRYPLVIFLHGSGERGNDNTAQLVNGVTEFVNPVNREKNPAFVVVPQCPKEKRWVEVSWKLPTHIQPDSISIHLGMVMHLVKSLTDSLPVDTNRIYISGISMGGFGTWDLITRYPEVFAAAIPVCGGGDETKAERLRCVPIWAFHGDKDKLVIPDRTLNMVFAVRKAGNRNAKFTLYKNVGHDSWTKTFNNPEVYEWLFKQKREKKK